MLFARWALSASALGVIGAFGATLLSHPANPRVIAVARRASFALILSSLLIVAFQLYAWFGIDGLTVPENVETMLSSTVWGSHWAWMAGVAVIVAGLLAVAASRPGLWIYANGASALAVAATVPLVGHGGTHDALTTLLHRVHLFGAGLWMGSLGVAVLAGIGDTTRLLSSLRRFAPVAMTGAAMIAASGLTLAWEHLRPLSTLWTTDYGLVLAAKVAAVLVVGGLGYVNWREPRLRVAIAEITIAVVVVLSLTALLSELPMPGGH
jgi:putative copper resistance protein D